MRNGTLALVREKVSLCVVFGQLSNVNFNILNETSSNACLAKQL